MMYYSIEYNILGINAGLIFLFLLIILGIILIKNRNILKPNKRKFILFLALFTFLFFMPILYHSSRDIYSLFQFFIDFLSYEVFGPFPCDSRKFGGEPCGISFFDRYGESLLKIIPLLAIIPYILSCLMISAYDKFKIKKIK